MMYNMFLLFFAFLYLLLFVQQLVEFEKDYAFNSTYAKIRDWPVILAACALNDWLEQYYFISFFVLYFTGWHLIKNKFKQSKSAPFHH